MEIEKILAAVDHTLLQPDATWEQIRRLCDDAMYYHTASVCIPPSFVRQAKEYVGDRMAICTVIGFPCGYNTTAVKVLETEDAVRNGADEIDMVINIGDLKYGQEEKVLEEIKAVRAACSGKVLKVIIETCLLTEEEKITMCRLVTEAGADYIKTSTGFSTGGATFDDVKLFREHVGEQVKIKAAGGISSLADAEEFMRLGASRLGTSRVVKLLKNPPETSEALSAQLTEKEKTVEGTVVSMSPVGVSSNLVSENAYIAVPADKVGEMSEALFAQRGYWNRYVYKVAGTVREIDNVVIVPKKAVTEIDGCTYVSVVQKSGEIVAQRFISGGYNADYYWVVDGLTEGMEICLE